MTDAKICGISDRAALEAAVAGGARYVGFVFYPPSPRNVTPQTARDLAALLPGSVIPVALTVDADDSLLDEIVGVAGVRMLQLHGSESPSRVAAVRARTGLPAMRAVKVSEAADLAAADPYLESADVLRFDAKPPADMAGALPGGNAVSFDWTILSGRRWPLPWMLSGGLDPDNVAEAIRISGAPAVDVSSGVESTPGRKDPERIARFLAAVHGAGSA